MQLQTSWPDYVFSKEYELPSLEAVEKQIVEKKHLSVIPSAKEIEENGGFELGDMNKRLLKKIEELTLYTIQQEKKINNQQEKLQLLEKRNKELEDLKIEIRKVRRIANKEIINL